MTTFHFPDDITETERARLDSIIEEVAMPDFDVHLVAERVPFLLGDIHGDKYTLFKFRLGRPGEFETESEAEAEATKPVEPASVERDVTLSPGTLGDVFRNLFGQIGEPADQSQDGVTISAEELQFAGRVCNSMKIIDRQPAAFASNFEISEAIIRDRETGELVGSVVRLGDGTWGYNKDNAS